jgi:hypothetical protein
MRNGAKKLIDAPIESRMMDRGHDDFPVDADYDIRELEPRSRAQWLRS